MPVYAEVCCASKVMKLQDHISAPSASKSGALNSLKESHVGQNGVACLFRGIKIQKKIV